MKKVNIIGWILFLALCLCGCGAVKETRKQISTRQEGLTTEKVTEELTKPENLSYSTERKDYESDEVFANFRSVTVGKIKEGRLYRSASPCDNQRGRASCADQLAGKAGIRYIINLSDPEENLSYYIKEEDFSSPYFKSLYEKGKVTALHMKVNYKGKNYPEKVADACKIIAGQDGPFLIHCVEGKERTGFVCMVLEALCGATFEELIEDYMISYDNYYGINKNSHRETYEAIVEFNIRDMLCQMSGVGKKELETTNFQKAAKQYLLQAGMQRKEIEKVQKKLME